MKEREDFELVRLAGGVHGLHSHRYGETCHPIIGPEAEARRLYVEGLRLPGRLAARQGEPLVIWDVGLGAAANACTVIRALGEVGGKVRLLSFDQSTEPLRFALRHAGKLPFLDGFEAVLQDLMSEGDLHVRQGGCQVHWTLVRGNFPDLMTPGTRGGWPAPHAILFDPHSPARNPEMWTQPLFSKMHANLDPARSCALATYSRSSLVRTALLLAGFHVGRGRGAGAKEETTLAANDPALLVSPLDRAWLERLQGSESAEPLREAAYRQAPLAPATLARLRTHPQFARVRS